MKYKLVERGNPARQGEPKKWYASPVNTGKLTVKSFAKEIAGRSSLTRGDIENVLNNFLDELPVFLKLGHSVKLGDFGTIRLGLSSEGVDNPDDFNTGKIKNVKVIFTAAPDLKKSLQDISYEEQK
jgi:predicted histone-like DNA-binding protein